MKYFRLSKPQRLTILACILTNNVVAQPNNDESVEVMSVTGYKQDMQESPASISVIDALEIENKGYLNVAEIVQDLPGVFITGGPSRKGGSTDISIRGMSSKHVLILVNGKPQSSRQAFSNGFGQGADFNWLPPTAAIERIEVIRGPMSSLYGSDALGGVINVITKEGEPYWNGKLSAEAVLQKDGDAGDSKKLKYYLNGPISDSIDFTLKGTGYKRDEDKIPNGYTDIEDVNHSAQLKWEYSDHQKFSIEVGSGRQESTGTLEGRGRDSESIADRDFYNIGHEISWGKADTNTFIQSEKVKDKTLANEYKQWMLDSKTHIPLGDTDVVIGAQYREQQTEQPLRAYNDTTVKRWDGALFSEVQQRINKKLSVTGGVRWVEDEQYGSEFVPRAYMVYKLNNQFTLKGGVSSGYKTPDLTQGDNNWVEGGGGKSVDGATIGNSELQPEHSTNYEFSINWSDNDELSSHITLYHTKFTDLIQKNTICEESALLAYDCTYFDRDYQLIAQYQNEDEAKIKGVEASLAYRANDFSVNLNYAYNDSEITTGIYQGLPLNDQPKHSANISTNWYPTEKIDLWLKSRYLSETQQIGSDKIPSYSTTDLGGVYAVNNEIKLYAGIYNVFDKEIMYEKFGRVIDGRRYNLGISYEF